MNTEEQTISFNYETNHRMISLQSLSGRGDSLLPIHKKNGIPISDTEQTIKFMLKVYSVEATKGDFILVHHFGLAMCVEH